MLVVKESEEGFLGKMQVNEKEREREGERERGRERERGGGSPAVGFDSQKRLRKPSGVH